MGQEYSTNSTVYPLSPRKNVTLIVPLENVGGIPELNFPMEFTRQKKDIKIRL